MQQLFYLGFQSIWSENKSRENKMIKTNGIQRILKKRYLVNPKTQKQQLPNCSNSLTELHGNYQLIDSRVISYFIYLIQLMSLSKLKERVKQNKSHDNLHFLQSQYPERKTNEVSHISNLRLSRPKRDIQSRLLTQINDKVTLSKEQLKRYAKILKIDAKSRKSQNKHKTNNSFKVINPNANSAKRLTKDKFMSPNISKILPKKEQTEIGSPIRNFLEKEKRGLRKGKQHRSQAKWKNEQNESILLLQKVRISKSREALSRKKSRKKHNKIFTQTSLDSTPSCLFSEEVDFMDQIGQGTFGKVFKGQLKRNGEMVAIKRVLQDSRYRNREMQIIRLLKNQFICQILGSYITQEGNHEYLNIVMRYYEQNLFQRIKSYPVGKMPNLETKIIIYQLFKGLSYLHSLKICHRDIKPQNLLLKGNAAAICDFGSAKILLPQQSNISYICARCYRAPELIFGATKYSTKVDIWSAGCLILQTLNGDPLFIGQTSISHLLQIIKILGTPTTQQVLAMNPEYDIRTYKFPQVEKQQWSEVLPDVDKQLLNLLSRIMVYSPAQRATALEVLSLQYFDELRDQLTFSHISSMYHLGNFFSFSEDQVANYQHLLPKLVPQWCNQ